MYPLWFLESLLLILILTGCGQSKLAGAPPDWQYLEVYKNIQVSINNYPNLFLPLPLGETISTQPFGMYVGPELSFDLFTEKEEKFIDSCKISSSGNRYSNDKNTVEEMYLLCPSPFEHEKYLYRLNVGGIIFYSHPGFLSTQKQRELIITSLLNARIDE